MVEQSWSYWAVVARDDDWLMETEIGQFGTYASPTTPMLFHSRASAREACKLVNRRTKFEKCKVTKVVVVHKSWG